MYPSKQLTADYKAKLSSFASKSEKEIEKKYRKCDEVEAKGLYLQVLIEIKEAISLGKIKDLKMLDKVLAVISKTENKLTLKSYFESEGNPIRGTNAIILACKHNQLNVLEHVFCSKCEILDNLSSGLDVPAILPNDEDGERHNTLYYAIRSSNVQLIETLIEKWPNNYFDLHLDKLDEILSRAYEELKLKNIILSDKMQIFVENKLINLRFFPEISEKGKNVKSSFSSIKERIRVVLENISMLGKEYSGLKEVDEKFLLTAKFVAQNIHILKRLLKPTYDRFPWEEMEFCLISFIKSKLSKDQYSDQNLVCSYILTEKRILMHLENFALQLNETKITKSDINKPLPYLKREEVIANIIHHCPLFKELYDDHEKIADIYSLDKIFRYIELALTVNPKEEKDRLIIMRVLQVIGEFLKNTMESPKLSCTASELLLLSAPKNTSKILADLRNSLSHAHAVLKIMEIGRNSDIFFANIQNDLKKIGVIIFDILFNFKMKTCRSVLKSIINSTSLQEMQEIVETFHFYEMEEPTLKNFGTSEYEKLKELIQNLSSALREKTDYERELFNKINNIIVAENSELIDNKVDNLLRISMLKSIKPLINIYKTDSNDLRGIKLFVIDVLENICPKMKPQSLKQIAEIAIEIASLAKPRLQSDNVDGVNKLMLQIFYVSQSEIDNIEWIEILREKLTKSKFSKVRASVELKNTHIKLALNEQGSSPLKMKLSALKAVLNDNALDSQLIENYPLYKDNRKLQAAVEMLVQDIMSILECSDYLTNNNFFLDDNAPLLIGKSLRNHLAHGNALIDILLFNPSIAIVSNASKLISENVSDNKKYIGKLVQDNPSGLKEKFERDLQIVVTQEAMFTALEKGNLEDLEISIKNGADIYARNVNLQTALHFAAKGPNLEILKLVHRDIMASKDVDNQTPLHVAVAYGNIRNVKFFVKEGFNVNEINSNKQTALHVAAQKGFKIIVEFLLKNGAETKSKDASGYSPVHYSVTNNHKDISIILLKKEIHVDANESIGGYTPLHIAADNGCLEIVLFLLQNKANVNAKNDRNWTPLHAAAVSGHCEIVQILILNGAAVDAKVLTDGGTPLQYAVENGDENMVKMLLKHGANVNTTNKIRNIPLHYAAIDGYVQIVELLLEKKASVNAGNIDGMSSLHFAAESGHKETVDLLIRNGARVEAKNNDGLTALQLSAYSGFQEVVELLIHKGADMHCKDKNGRTLLHLAGVHGNKEVVELLLAKEMDVNSVDMFGSTTLHLSSINGHIGVMDVLIKKGAKVNAMNKENIMPLHLVSGAVFSCQVAKMLSQYAPNTAMKISHEYRKKIVDQTLIADDIDISGKRKSCENGEAVKFLLDNGAGVNTKCWKFSPLHLAARTGDVKIVDILIKEEAEVNAKDSNGDTPLHFAVRGNHRKVVKILIENGADIDSKNKTGVSSILYAIKYNYDEIVESLLEKGADVSEGLSIAIACGFKNIAESILKNKKFDTQDVNNELVLHVAAMQGFKSIVETLIKKGSDVNAITKNRTTLLYAAAQGGHKEVVKVLLKNKANANIKSDEGFTALHVAAAQGHNHVVEVLLSNETNVEIKDNMNRTPIELATSFGHHQVVKTLLRYKSSNINSKGNDNWTVLHIASQAGNLETINLLMDAGADINAKNTPGSKPMHIAAREGHKSILHFFLNSGCHIDDRGSDDSTLLHYAAIGGRLEIAKYLMEQNVDVNVTNINDLTPLHLAAHCGNEEIAKYLLSKGAIFNAIGKFNSTPIDLAKDENIKNVLKSIDKLFEAVKLNKPLDVGNLIEAGAFIDAKNADNVMPLHYAAWKGFAEVADILLKAQANPNASGKNGFTPLHYATKYSHLRIVQALLSNGAIYNSCAANGRTPINFADHEEIANLLEFVEQTFDKIKSGDSKIIGILKKVKDIDIIKAVMNARNRENRTLMTVAIHHDFPKIEALKQILQGDVRAEMELSNILISQEKFQDALNILRNVLAKRETILGPDDPAILEIQVGIAKVLFGQKKYQESLNMLEEIYVKQKDILGINDVVTLNTRSTIALILHRQGKNEDALKIYQEVYKRQKKILGENNTETLDTQCHMALVLDVLEKYEEALSINNEIFEKKKRSLGENDQSTLTVQNNIAWVLSNVGKYEEAIKIYKEVYEKRKKVLGLAHSDSLRPLHNIAIVFLKQEKYDEALKALQDVFGLQKKYLGFDHLDTLNSQDNIAGILFQQGKWLRAFKAYKNGFDRRRVILGPNHPSIALIHTRLEIMEKKFKCEGKDISKIIGTDIFVAANNGDIEIIQSLLDEETDVNARDTEGRTALHFAANLGHEEIVSILLKNGADATIASSKANTPLHSATSKDNRKIVEMLLEHVKQENHVKFDNFINSQTTASGSTSLHIAAKNGFFEIAKCLLKHGAVYDTRDKSNNKTALDDSKSRNIINLLTLVDQLFDCAEKGNSSIDEKLNQIRSDELKAILNARNHNGQTLMQVALVSKHKLIANTLVQLLLKKNRT